MVVGVAAMLSISIADTYFLGKLGTAELAAISFTFPVVLTVTSLAIGMSAGATSFASRSIGRGDTQHVKRLATDSLVLSFVVVSLVSALGWLISRPLFALIGAEGEVLDMIVTHMRIWFVSVPFLAVPMVGMGLVRANGDSTFPSIVMVLTAVVNIALDPVFIFGWGAIPAMGVDGAAWAAFGGRIVMLSGALVLLVFKEKLLAYDLPSPAEFLQSAREIFKVGVPAAGSNMINPLSTGIVTALLAGFGHETVAAFGVATRVESFTTIPMLALSSAIGPVAGQNWGRGKPERTAKAIASAFIFVVVCGVVLGAAFIFLSGPFVAVFTDDTVVQNLARSYLVIVGLTLGGYGIVINASAAFNAIDRALIGLIFTILRSFILYVPAVWYATTIGPPWAVWVAIALTNVLAGLIVAIAAFAVLKRKPGGSA